MIKLTASHSESFHTGLKKCIKEQPPRCFKPCSITSVLSSKILDPALANDCVSFREFSINEAVNFLKIHRINQRKGPGYPENEFWNNFKQYYLVYKRKIYANPRRFDRDGKTSVMTSWTCWGERHANTRSRNRVVSRLSARFLVLKWRSRPLAKSLYCLITTTPWSWVSRRVKKR